MAQARRLQYAVVGCGGRGLGYVRLLAAADGAFADVDLLALCDAHEATRNNLGEECGISSEHLHETVADMLEADGDALDCVVIATPAHLNKICALPCIERGLHVMMEKPVRSPDPTTPHPRQPLSLHSLGGAYVTAGALRRRDHGASRRRQRLGRQGHGRLEPPLPPDHRQGPRDGSRARPHHPSKYPTLPAAPTPLRVELELVPWDTYQLQLAGAGRVPQGHALLRRREHRRRQHVHGPQPHARRGPQARVVRRLRVAPRLSPSHPGQDVHGITGPRAGRGPCDGRRCGGVPRVLAPRLHRLP